MESQHYIGRRDVNLLKIRLQICFAQQIRNRRRSPTNPILAMAKQGRQNCQCTNVFSHETYTPICLYHGRGPNCPVFAENIQPSSCLYFMLTICRRLAPSRRGFLGDNSAILIATSNSLMILFYNGQKQFILFVWH